MQELSAEHVPERRTLLRGLVLPCCALGGDMMMSSDRHWATGSRTGLNDLKADENALLSVTKELQTLSGCGGSWFLSTHLPHTPLPGGSLCSAHRWAQLQETALLCSLNPVELKLQQLSSSDRDPY